MCYYANPALPNPRKTNLSPYYTLSFEANIPLADDHGPADDPPSRYPRGDAARNSGANHEHGLIMSLDTTTMNPSWHWTRLP